MAGNESQRIRVRSRSKMAIRSVLREITASASYPTPAPVLDFITSGTELTRTGSATGAVERVLDGEQFHRSRTGRTMRSSFIRPFPPWC